MNSNQSHNGARGDSRCDKLRWMGWCWEGGWPQHEKLFLAGNVQKSRHKREHSEFGEPKAFQCGSRQYR